MDVTIYNENHIKCPICTKYLVAPRSAKCGHHYCHKCIDEYLLTENMCVVCSAYIKNKKLCPSFTVENIIRKIISKNCAEKILEYKNLVNEYNRWIDARTVSDLAAGLEIDVKDTEDIWCKGTVSEIKISKQSLIIKVHYNGWSQIYDEYMSLNSERIATRGFYTNRDGRLIRYSPV